MQEEPEAIRDSLAARLISIPRDLREMHDLCAAD